MSSAPGGKSHSIRRRVTALITLTTCFALTLACAAFVLFDLVSFKTAMADDLSTIAEIVGMNSTAALVFGDPVAASEVLESLAARPHVVSGVIYDARGEIFAKYHSRGEQAPPRPARAAGHWFEEGFLHVLRPVMLDGDSIGTLHLLCNTDAIYLRLRRYGTAVSVTLLGCIGVTLLLSARLQRLITAPIQRLAGAARAVAVDKDYKIRAPEEQSEELGMLTRAFNEMLDTIEQRDDALRRAQGELESLVARRTQQLESEVSSRQDAEEALRRSEEQLRQAQKMEAIGRLAGGVAHDFNNLLTAITGYAELMMHQLSADDPLCANVKEIKRASDRAASLTRQLLAFSRKQVLEPKVFHLNAVVESMEKMLRRLIGEDILLRAVLDPKLGGVMADQGQIEQVLMNLVVNARDAMPEGGKLTIETRNVDLTEDYALAHASVQAGRYVMVAVSDTGCGMDEETRSRIFEPFFTTKEMGKGTGLGLSTVYGIVKQSGGNIWVYSEPGRGSTFKVYLPRVEAAVQVEAPRPARTISKGTETILLVEDEEMVRRLAASALRMSGYTVLEAPHGGEALMLCERHTGSIDLVLTDVVMPHLNGRELWDRLSVRRPGMKVLYMSGYTDAGIVHHGVLDPETDFIQKPFTPTLLLSKVRDVLQKAAHG